LSHIVCIFAATGPFWDTSAWGMAVVHVLCDAGSSVLTLSVCPSRAHRSLARSLFAAVCLVYLLRCMRLPFTVCGRAVVWLSMLCVVRLRFLRDFVLLRFASLLRFYFCA
jgi:hypothetical protein